jgi:hypothetical protein
VRFTATAIIIPRIDSAAFTSLLESCDAPLKQLEVIAVALAAGGD